MSRKLVRYSDIEGKNPGWTPGADGVILINPRFGQVIHTWTCDDDKPLFDGMLRAEPGGGVFLPIDDQGRIGLQLTWRPQTNDMKAWREAWPNVDVEALGRMSWEVPRGFAEGSDADGNVTATREAEEETGSVVVSARPLGQVCDNTASSPHMTAVQIGNIDLGRRSDLEGDPNEKLAKSLQYFDRTAVAKMVTDGDLYCGYTLAAIGMWLLDI